jgi:hypothetical protein
MPIALTLDFYDPSYSIADVTFLFSQHFDAHLPAVEAAVRITSICDAQFFTCRWVIRDKDRDLKALLRHCHSNSCSRGTGIVRINRLEANKGNS